MGVTAHLVSHTHWDREWYLTQEQFRLRLVRLIDELLDRLDGDPAAPSFMLDGQANVLEDYLAVKPYNRRRLRAAIAAGKIVCGPWYILPDEVLVSGEAHIRNFLAGQRLLREMGGGMNIAYLPDSFGHPAQMPQIIAGLGMNTMLFWRGVPHSVAKTEFVWRAPGGRAEILCVHMPHGYGNSAHLSADMQETLPRLAHLLGSLQAKSTTDVVLLMNGSDHITGQKDIAAVVAEVNRRMPENRVLLSTMAGFMNDLKPRLPEGLAVCEGEFRSGERSMLLGGTISTRMPLKLANDAAQNTAERYLEPMLAAEMLAGGGTDVRGPLAYLWRKILENHPHDSICGCSIDEVHREMVTRSACTSQVQRGMLEDAAARLARQPLPGGAAGLLLFEPATTTLPGYAEVEVAMDSTLVQWVDYTRSLIVDAENEITHSPLPGNVEVRDEQGREIPCVLLAAEKGYERLYQDFTMPEVYKINRVRLGLLLPGFGCGVHTLAVRPAPGKAAAPAASDDSFIENEHYRVAFVGAQLSVLDKRTGTLHQNAAQLVDRGDAGDEYSYSWPQKDETFTLEDAAATVRKTLLPGLGQRLTLTAAMVLPAALTGSRTARSGETVACPLTLTVSLWEGLDRIDFDLDFENNARDHLLQMQFPAGFVTDVSHSYNTFHVMERPVQAPVPEEWMEYPQNSHPTHGFVCLQNGRQGLCLSTGGLTDFEAVQLADETALNLTLLRCVGWLSRTDLASRKGNGGWTIETPEAQCQGRHHFRFALQYYQGGWQQANSFALMEKHRLPACILPVRGAAGANPLAFLAAGLPPGVCLSALKPAEAQDGVVLRLFNLHSSAAEFMLPLPAGVYSAGLASLAEEWRQTLTPQNGALPLRLEGHEILTLYLKTSPVPEDTTP